jgi:hypothetical protein
MQPKHLGTISSWYGINILLVFGQLDSRIGRNLIPKPLPRPLIAHVNIGNIVISIGQHIILQIVLTISIEQLTIEIISDTASVLNLTDHIFDDFHVHLWLLAAAWGHAGEIGQVFLDEQ